MAPTLHVSPRDPGRIRLVQITDTHVARDPGPTDFEGVDTEQTLAAVLQAVAERERDIDAVLLTGDLVDLPSAEAYGRVAAQLCARPWPVACLPGNHDDPALMAAILNTGTVSTPRALQLGDWRVLMLNDWVAGSPAGRLGPGEIGFLRAQLADADGAPVLVCLHHAPVSIASPWMDAMGLEDAGGFLGTLDAFANVRGVVFGHIHQEFVAEHRGIPLLGTPSTCVQFQPGAHHYAVEDRPPGYRVLDLLPGGRLVSEVRRI